jgi:para-nitrobenzyl esterase
MGVTYPEPGTPSMGAPPPAAKRPGPLPQPERGITLIPEPIAAGDNELNLNIFTPDLGAAGLPVFVWIHGGAKPGPPASASGTGWWWRAR